VDGFKAGQKMAIGYGATYPAVSATIEKYEVVTITSVGKQGTQAWLSANAKAGDTNIKVSSVANITAGDKIRLDIDSKGHGIETVTVKSVGTQSVRNTFGGPLKANEDVGTGLELVEPLKFDHASNIPFSCKGTGISFEPATAFAHSSNEPVLPLGTGIMLDQPLSMDHSIDAVVRDQSVKSAGYQETQQPNQWFGGPALSARSGNIILRDAAGNVVDGLNYGGLTDPWAAEGYQAASGAGESGCSVASPSSGRSFRPSSSSSQPNRSAGRYPDGFDSDNNCRDFVLQNPVTTLGSTAAGSNNIKVSSTTDLSIGQKIIIDAGISSRETAVVAVVGTPGGTVLNAATKSGSKVIPVTSAEGFIAGQTITIDCGTDLEAATIASIMPARRRMGNNNPADSVKLAMPLTRDHISGAQVSGSGITLVAPLTKAHESGTLITGNLPTPGEPNVYTRRP
jgi:hypothetical protein